MKKKLVVLSVAILGLSTCHSLVSMHATQSVTAPRTITAHTAAEAAVIPHASQQPPARTQYSLSVIPTVMANDRVKMEISTNIPGTIEIMADLSLHGQAGNDIWIGKNDRVRLIRGRGAITFATQDLPKGRYDAIVSFYPKWGFQDATSRATGISANLEASAPLTLGGSGESATAVQFKKNGQSWVMANVTMGDPWSSKVWVQQFGQYQELLVDRGNPAILKAYYFPRIDVTLIVNTLKNEIAVWRLGKAHG